MIIGISGKKQSGKDLTGKIVQLLLGEKDLTTEDIQSLTIECIMEEPSCDNTWQIKRFADALKQIASILTGIPVEDFEKEEVKNSVLGEEWIRYGYADGFWSHSDFNPSHKMMNNKQCDKEQYEIELRTNWQTAYKSHLTYRELLQYVGTDLFRDKLHNDTWVNVLMKDYKKNVVLFDEDNKQKLPGHLNTPLYPNWIITDVRFPNEVKAIKDRGGIVIRVNRNNYPGIKNSSFKTNIKTGEIITEHLSETALDDYTFDDVIDNDGTIEELIEKVRVVLTKHKLL